MRSLINKLVSIKSNKTARQTTLLFSSKVYDLGLGALTNFALAKFMGSDQYGKLAFLISFFQLGAVIYEFGLTSSTTKMLAQSKHQVNSKRLLGSYILLELGIMVFLALCVFVFSFVRDDIYTEKNLGEVVRVLSFIAMAFVIPGSIQLILSGTNDIRHLAYFNISWRSLYTLCIGIFFMTKQLTVNPIILAQGSSMLICAAAVMFFLRPDFTAYRQTFSDIWQDMRRYGLYIYFTRLLDRTTVMLDKMMIGYFPNL
jgi:O-antigen/teichoic acid export membrane protein